tara:strand:- start:641 stop:910 length:270 start_codon:yes stop_codon:yes gene_type:complete
VSRLFKPKVVMPPVPPAPEPVRYTPPSSIETKKEEVASADPTQAIQEDPEKEAIKEKVEKKKTGRKQTILTGPRGLTTEADIYAPTLLS